MKDCTTCGMPMRRGRDDSGKHVWICDSCDYRNLADTIMQKNKATEGVTMPRMTFHNFYELPGKAQESAVDMCASELLQHIVSGALTFTDEMTHELYGNDVHGDDLQQRIDAAFGEAEEMRTPWFAHEYVMDTCREDIMCIARADAADMLYAVGRQQLARVLPNDTVCRA